MNTPLIMAEALAKVRLRADIRESQFINDEELQDLMEDSFNTIYNEVLQLRTGLFIGQVDNITPVDGNRINLPPDFYKVKLLEQQYVGSGRNIAIKQLNLAEASQLSGVHFWGNVPSAAGYVLFDDHLLLYPEDSVAGLRFKLSYGRDILLNMGQMRDEIKFFLYWNTAYLHSIIAQNPQPQLQGMAMMKLQQVKEWLSDRDQSPKTIKDTAGAFSYL